MMTRKLKRNQSGRNARSEVPQQQLILYGIAGGVGLCLYICITVTQRCQDQSQNTELLSETAARHQLCPDM